MIECRTDRCNYHQYHDQEIAKLHLTIPNNTELITKSRCIIKPIKSESEGKTHLYNGVARLPDDTIQNFVMLQFLISETALDKIIKYSM